MISHLVLPKARPRLQYEARDDYGIAAVRIHMQVVRHRAADEESASDEMETQLIDVSLDGRKRLQKGTEVINLLPLGLRKGDELKLTLEAIDYRGERPGASKLSEPLVLKVTDQSGFLASLVESDEKSARRLDSIIERQLGIGESQ